MSTFETNPIQLQRPDMPYIIYTTLYINRTKVVQSGWLRSFKQRLFSFAQSCLILHVPMDFSTPGFPGLHYLLEFAQTHVHWVADAIQLSHPPLLPFSSCLPSFPASGSFSMSQLFESSGQSIGTSASASVFPMNIQGWFPLGLTGLISLQSRDSQESPPAPQLESIVLWCSAFFMVQLLHLCMTTRKIIALTITDICWQSAVTAFSYTA